MNYFFTAIRNAIAPSAPLPAAPATPVTVNRAAALPAAPTPKIHAAAPEPVAINAAPPAPATPVTVPTGPVSPLEQQRESFADRLANQRRLEDEENRKWQEDHQRQRIEREEQNERDAIARREKENAERNRQPSTFEERFSMQSIYHISPADDFGGLPPKLLAHVIASDSELAGFIADQARAIEPYMIQYETAASELSKLNITSARALLRKVKADNFSAAKRGDLAAIRPLPDAELEEERIRHQRAVWREAERGASASCEPAFVAIGERIKLAARVLAGRMDQDERAEAESIGVKYKPSETLCRIATAGFHFPKFISLAYNSASRSDPKYFLLQFMPAKETK